MDIFLLMYQINQLLSEYIKQTYSKRMVADMCTAAGNRFEREKAVADVTVIK